MRTTILLTALLLTLSACQPQDINPDLIGEPVPKAARTSPSDPEPTIKPTFCIFEGEFNRTVGSQAFISSPNFSYSYLRIKIQDKLNAQGIFEYTAERTNHEGREGLLVTVPTHDATGLNNGACVD